MMEQYEKNAVYKVTYSYQWGKETKQSYYTTAGNMVSLTIRHILEYDSNDILEITKIHDNWFEYTKLVALGQI